MSGSVLILSYFFPPYPGVGGRRWAKFAKYLARDGMQVHVICAENPLPSTSSWMADVQKNEKLFIHAIPGRYPKILIGEPKSFLARAVYRATGIALGLFTPGNKFDHSLFWNRAALQKAEELIEKHQIRNVIATGAPFHVLHKSLQLKKTRPNIRLICDFRDPWTDDRRNADHWPANRYQYEQKLELEVLRGADVVTAPSEQMTATFQKRAGDVQTQFITLKNGFDPDDLKSLPPLKTRSDNEIRFIYAGTLYNEIEEIFSVFLNALIEIKKDRPVLYQRLRFSFFGSFPEKYAAMIDKYDLKIIQRCGYATLPTLYERISESDYGMIFFHEDPAYTMISKFFYYLPLRKKIVFVSKPTAFMKYLEENGIGYGCPTTEMRSKLETILESHDRGGAAFNLKFDVDQFSIGKLASQLKKLFQDDSNVART